MRDLLKTVRGQPSWRIATREVEAYVTQTGGQVGPTTFRLGRRLVQPFSVAPWAEEPGFAVTPPMLRALRGDFFCMPFGGNGTPYRGERHPPHGETANRAWRLDRATPSELQLSMHLRVRSGRVDKLVQLRAGQHAIYQRHTIRDMAGRMSFGHHAMLRFPDRPGSGLISTSGCLLGQVAPLPVEDPQNRGYSCLRPGATFKALNRVPTTNGTLADLSRYPARRGFEDLVLLASDPGLPFAWTAVVFPAERYVWFALKDPRVLSQTIFWISNGGRHYPPWNGRHVNVMGLEEVTSNFHYGLAESVRRNPLNTAGLPTCHRFRPDEPVVVNYIMAVAPVPRGFNHVAAITPDPDGPGVRLAARNGRQTRAPIDLGFLG